MADRFMATLRVGGRLRQADVDRLFDVFDDWYVGAEDPGPAGNAGDLLESFSDPQHALIWESSWTGIEAVENILTEVGLDYMLDVDGRYDLNPLLIRKLGERRQESCADGSDVHVSGKTLRRWSEALHSGANDTSLRYEGAATWVMHEIDSVLWDDFKLPPFEIVDADVEEAS